MESFVLELLENLLEEAEDEKFLGSGRRNAPGFEVEHLFLVDMSAGGAVGAANIIGLDLQAGKRIALGLVAEDQVPVALEGIGLLCLRIDDDEAGEDGARPVEKCVFVEQIGAGVRGLVPLQRALIEFLCSLCGSQGEHLAECARALEADSPMWDRAFNGEPTSHEGALASLALGVLSAIFTPGVKGCLWVNRSM